jgi:hypothetical protein
MPIYRVIIELSGNTNQALENKIFNFYDFFVYPIQIDLMALLLFKISP